MKPNISSKKKSRINTDIDENTPKMAEISKMPRCRHSEKSPKMVYLGCKDNISAANIGRPFPKNSFYSTKIDLFDLNCHLVLKDKIFSFLDFILDLRAIMKSRTKI
jgi:hypothetical protein